MLALNGKAIVRDHLNNVQEELSLAVMLEARNGASGREM